MSMPIQALESPVPSDQQRWRDEEHLRLLSIFHFVVGGLTACVLPFLVIHFLFFITFFANAAAFPGAKEGAFPREMIPIFIAFYCFAGLVTSVYPGGNLMCQVVAQTFQTLGCALGFAAGRKNRLCAKDVVAGNDLTFIRKLQTIEDPHGLVCALSFGSQRSGFLQAGLGDILLPTVVRTVLLDQFCKSHLDESDNSKEPHARVRLLEIGPRDDAAHRAQRGSGSMAQIPAPSMS